MTADHRPVFECPNCGKDIADTAVPHAIGCERDAQRGSVGLGDIVCMNETSTYFHDWRGIEMKIVSLRLDPDGVQWASTIDAPYDQRHRGNGVYDGETTDIDVRHLSRKSP